MNAQLGKNSHCQIAIVSYLVQESTQIVIHILHKQEPMHKSSLQELPLCRKIVGARFYYKGFIAYYGPLESSNKTFFLSARDNDGHGTHTASTIAGSVVPSVSLYGIGKGTARGGAPRARLAIYKPCWFNLCSDADLLSAIDDAISDGVDIISMSLGPRPPQPIYLQRCNFNWEPSRISERSTRFRISREQLFPQNCN